MNLCNAQRTESAWIFAFNHGIDDQQSVNILVQDLITNCTPEPPNAEIPLLPLFFPPSVELAICPGVPNPLTLLWSMYQLFNSLCFASTVPKQLRQRIKRNPEMYKRFTDPDQRSTFCEFISLNSNQTSHMVQRSKEKGVSVTHTVSAAVLIATALLLQQNTEEQEGKEGRAIDLDDLTLRFLLSVGLRPYGVGKTDGLDWTGGTVACAGGAIDYIIRLQSDSYAPFVPFFTGLEDNSTSSSSTSSSSSSSGKSDPAFPSIITVPDSFWTTAKQSQELSRALIKLGFVPESMRLFNLGMDLVDILQAVELEARNPSSLGRGFTCGVSSVGVVSFTPANGLAVKEVYYGTSHGRNGVTCLLSCLTVNKDTFTGCLQFPAPIVDRSTAKRVRQTIEAILSNL